MNAYTKIETVYKRDIDGTKKLIEGNFRNEAVEFLKDKDWIFTEKVDGTNIGIVWDGHKVSYQGRTERAQIPAHLTNKLISIFGTNEAEEMFEQTFGEKNVVLFGEGYGAKIQKGGGNYIPDDCGFILFDVYMADSDTWLKRGSAYEVAMAFGVPIVPVVMVGTIEKAVDFIKGQPKSLINSAHEMEGVVGRPVVDFYDRNHDRLIVKIKVRDFV